MCVFALGVFVGVLGGSCDLLVIDSHYDEKHCVFLLKCGIGHIWLETSAKTI